MVATNAALRSIRIFSPVDRVIVGGAAAFTALSALTRYVDLGTITAFICSMVAIGLLAAVVGRAVDHLGDRFGAGATGVLQSALGNLPELFIGLFALRAGLRVVVEAAVIGSILSNILLILGLAFVAGGLKNGTQYFSGERARTTTTLMLLAVAAMLVPSLTSYLHTPASQHERALSLITAAVLLTVFALSVPSSLRRGEGEGTTQAAAASETAGGSGVGGAAGTSVTVGGGVADGPDVDARPEREATRWPVALSVGALAAAGVLAAFVSDWFVTALQPAMDMLNVSQAFAGLVVVAIAGNAVENVVGIQLAFQNRADYALSVILNSPLQIALVLAPLLVLLSPLVGGVTFTLVFAPLLVAAVAASVLIVIPVVYDAESNWLEGVALVGLYLLIAAAFWWG